MIRRHASKYRESSSRTSSASRDSDNGVNPTRSAKRTETRRRSAAGFSRVATGASAASGVPQSPQNASSGSFTAPQLGHASASGDPHREQNFRPGRFSVPHEGQFTPRSLGVERASFHPTGDGDDL